MKFKSMIRLYVYDKRYGEESIECPNTLFDNFELADKHFANHKAHLFSRANQIAGGHFAPNALASAQNCEIYGYETVNIILKK